MRLFSNRSEMTSKCGKNKKRGNSKSSEFLSSEHPRELKKRSLKSRLENLQLRSTLEAIRFQGAFLTVEICVLYINDPQISLIHCGRHSLAAIQFKAMSCSELNFVRCCALRRLENSRRIVFICNNLCCDVSFLTSICVNNYLTVGKRKLS